jgi:hypothetical protein
MSTPHDPGQSPDDSTTPQDPSDPQNPYAPPPSDQPAPPPPPPPPPYGDQSTPGSAVPPPATPYGQPPAPEQPPAYGQQPAPAYQQPAYQQPAYQQPAYQQPAYQQPAYAQPGYPQYDAAPAEPGKGMAIAALVLAILGCTCITLLVAVPLAIIVLLRGRDGRNHGKGLAIAALVISALYVIGGVIGGAAVYNYAKDLKGPNDLKAGDCITAHGLNDTKADTIDTIKTVSCSDDHDGEVLATTTVTAELAKDFSQMDPDTTCRQAIDAAGKTPLLTEDLAVTALTVTDPQEGDMIACVAYNADGSKLTGRLGS